VLTDGNWHKILENLDGINAFEIIAHASGSANSGYYSISHAIALSTFGSGSSSKIKNYQNSNWSGYGFLGKLFNKKKVIRFRWTGTLHNYSLEVKTGKWPINPETNDFFKIHYNISKLIN